MAVTARSLWGALAGGVSAVLWPRLCPVCGERMEAGQRLMCLDCLLRMPAFRDSLLPLNAIHERLAAPGLPIDRAYALMRYRRGSPYTAIILDAKYRGRPRFAYEAGRLLAVTLGPQAWAGIDALVPVPMSPWKQARRGFNQAELVARGIGAETAIPVRPWLERVHGRATQTRLSAWLRTLNAAGDVALAPGADTAMRGMHVMLVDDVVTTGATMAESLRLLAPHAGTLSVAAVAATEKQ